MRKPDHKIIGQTFNRLTIKEACMEKDKGGGHLYFCECVCGNVKKLNGSQVKIGATKSCGCLKTESAFRNLRKTEAKEMIGKKFNMLTILSHAKNPNQKSKSKAYFYKCECECGNIKIINGASIRSNVTKSCGCFKQKNIKPRYKSEHPSWTGCGDIYGTWFNTLKRNAEKRNIPFEITIEDMWSQWLEQDGCCALTGEILTIAKDRSHKLNRSASLDRVDSNKGYFKNNIQFVHQTINYMKQNYEESIFISWCEKVVNFNKSIDT